MTEIADNDLQSIEKMLNTTISGLLYGGCSDPGWSECAGAAACFKTLKLLRLHVKDEDYIREELSNPEKNICENNFLK